MNTRRLVRTLLLLLLIAVGLPSVSGAQLRAAPVATGFDRPLGMVPVPGRAGTFVVFEQPGRVRVLVNGVTRDAAIIDLRAAASTAARTKLNKQLEAQKKQQLELLAYDEKMRHHADMRISLDLDDGVKVNYGRFGDLLAEVKAVTGGAADE